MDTQTKHHAKYDALIARCDGLDPVCTAVIHPCDAASLESAAQAAAAGIILPILVGPEAKIRRTADDNAIDIAGLTLVATPHSHAAAERAVAMVRAGEATALMKGSLHT